MSVSSMTGFVRSDATEGTYSWGWEIKSVNAKGRDIRCRLPSGFEALEQTVRDKMAQRFSRGSFSVSLSLSRDGNGVAIQINQEALEQVASLVSEVEKKFPGAAPPSIDGLLSLRGVVETIEEEPSPDALKAFEKAALEDFNTALESLAEMRLDEGRRMAEILEGQLAKIESLQSEAAKAALLQPDAIKKRLTIKVSELLEGVPALPEERLAQEAALLMGKADVREELDRLEAHIAAARDLLSSGAAVGRKLDFLCQEFNREANTLCAKSADLGLSGIGLELKATIEQFREQVQNIE
jgi:uncharacterized protein (TIGR00255 family)